MTNAICMAPDSFSRLPLRDSAAERKGFESGTLSDRMRDGRGMRTHCPYPGGSAFARLALGGRQADNLDTRGLSKTVAGAAAFNHRPDHHPSGRGSPATEAHAQWRPLD